MKTIESRAEVYFRAFQSLSKSDKQTVISRLLDDQKVREDILDLAVIRERQGEPSRPFREVKMELEQKWRRRP